jgi:transposase
MYKLQVCSEDVCMVDIDFSVGAGPLRQRRRRSAEERRLILEEALEPGASVARVARKHGVNANQVFAWKRLYESGRLGAAASGMKLLPVRVVEEPAPVKEPATEIAPLQTGTMHIELPGRALISLEGTVDPAMIRAVLRSLGA